MSEKLAAIGELTAGVAHEINNPIAVIQGNLDVLREVLGPATAPVATTLTQLQSTIFTSRCAGCHSGGGATLPSSMNLSSAAEVDTEFARWVSAGAAPVKQPEAAVWGGYSSYLADPDGHLWELAHNPYLPLNADGSPQLPD